MHLLILTAGFLYCLLTFSRLHALNERMVTVMWRSCKNVVAPYSVSVCIEQLRKTTNILSHGIQFPGQNLNSQYLEHKLPAALFGASTIKLFFTRFSFLTASLLLDLQSGSLSKHSPQRFHKYFSIYHLYKLFQLIIRVLKIVRTECRRVQTQIGFCRTGSLCCPVSKAPNTFTYTHRLTYVEETKKLNIFYVTV
jgi:hypothetical protein